MGVLRKQPGGKITRVLFALVVVTCLSPAMLRASDHPNILVMISDDVSFPHASAYGSTMVKTPHFDRVAKQGVLFTNAFCPAPGCSPSRAAFLTGRHIWMIEEAGTHASYFQTKYETFPERLAAAGYFVGSTGKAWGPGDFKKNGRTHNPAGPSFRAPKGGETRYRGYAGGFERFLQTRPKDKPFCFWFGSTDAHRSYKKGSGLGKGMKLEQAEVPKFLPDRPEIRSDLLDYAFEVERFDDDCGKMLELLKETGESDNTIVIITSDNGMPFPRAKANCYEYGIHMPLAMRWPMAAPANRVWDDLVGFVDLTATIYAATGVEAPKEFPVVGRSFLADLRSKKQGRVDPQRTFVLSGRERHSSSRFNTLGYPQRALRTHQFLYIRNFKPERWPAGTPRKYGSAIFESGKLVSGELGPPHGGYHDIDACPSLTFLIQNADDPELSKYLGWSVDRRPKEELFDIAKDPDCLHNLADDPKYKETRIALAAKLQDQLEQTDDPRVRNQGDVFEQYPRVSRLRWFPEPDWVRAGEAPPVQDWLERRRPKKN